MPFRIERNDITEVRADCIVNTADPEPIVGWGTDSAVHQKAGPELLRARRMIGYIEPGDAEPTPAFGLDADYVMHTVSPVWTGGENGEVSLLRRAYDTALYKAKDLGCTSIAFPLMAAGNLGFPRPVALKTAVDAFTDFLMENEMDIVLVVFDESVYRLSGKLMDSVDSFIDENYIDAAIRREYSSREIKELNDSLSQDDDWLDIELIRRGQKGSPSLRSRLDRMLGDYPLLEEVLDSDDAVRAWESRIEAEVLRHEAEIEDGSFRRKRDAVRAGKSLRRSPRNEILSRFTEEPPVLHEGTVSEKRLRDIQKYRDDQAEKELRRMVETEARKAAADQRRRSIEDEERESEYCLYQQALPGEYEEDDDESSGDILEECSQPIVPPSEQSLSELLSCKASQPNDLRRVLQHLDAGFSDTLRELIINSGEKASDIYKKANIDRKLFSKIMNNPGYQPSKPTAIAFALALHLDLEATSDLIRRAGYAMTRSSMFDVIIEFCIENHIWNVIEINTILFEYDQPLIGTK